MLGFHPSLRVHGGLLILQRHRGDKSPLKSLMPLMCLRIILMKEICDGITRRRALVTKRDDGFPGMRIGAYIGAHATCAAAVPPAKVALGDIGAIVGRKKAKAHE
jgi:hypothetical protein